MTRWSWEIWSHCGIGWMALPPRMILRPRHPDSENAAAHDLCRMWIGVGTSERRLLLSKEAHEALCQSLSDESRFQPGDDGGEHHHRPIVDGPFLVACCQPAPLFEPNVAAFGHVAPHTRFRVEGQRTTALGGPPRAGRGAQGGCAGCHAAATGDGAAGSCSPCPQSADPGGGAGDCARSRVERPHGVLAIDGIHEKNPRPRGGRGSNIHDLVPLTGFEPVISTLKG